MFRAADMMAVTKLDLLDAIGDFDPGNAKRHLRELANAAPVLELSARSGIGLDTWLDWLVVEAAATRRVEAAHG
jgi:hydrogenase nickel incorporation protein HypB